MVTEEHHAHAIAGHSVMAWLQGLQIVDLSLEPRWKGVASAENAPPTRCDIHGDGRERQNSAHAMLRCLLARPAAFLHYSFGLARGEMGIRFPEMREATMVSDAFSVAAQLASNPARLVSEVYGDVADIIDRSCVWLTITIIAEALVAHGALSGRQAVEVMSRRMHGLGRLPWILPIYSTRNPPPPPMSLSATPVPRRLGSAYVRHRPVDGLEDEEKRFLSMRWRQRAKPRHSRPSHRLASFRRYS